MQQPEVTEWGEFSSPFYSLRYPAPESLNAELSKLFLSQESEGEKFRNPEYIPSNQVRIFESSFDLFKRSEACVVELKQFFLHGVLQAVSRSSGYSMEECARLKVVTDAWYHVTRFGGYISNHTHPMASWSAVYMVDPGDQPKDLPRGGILSFKDPRPHANMYRDPGNEQWRTPYHMGSRNMEMLPGDLTVFPSFLQHEVTPYFGQAPRITVAANCSIHRDS